jgi:hypothetical protein
MAASRIEHCHRENERVKTIIPTFRSIFSKINISPDSVFEKNQINLDF